MRIVQEFDRVVTEFKTTFPVPYLPPWLGLRDDGIYGGAGIAAGSTPARGITLLTPYGPSTAAGLVVAPDRPVNLGVDMLEIKVVITGAGDNTTALFFGIRNLAGNQGVGVARNANNGTVYLRGYGSPTVDQPTTFVDLVGSDKRHSVGFRLYPNFTDEEGVTVHRTAFVMDEEPFDWWDFSTTAVPLTGDLFPLFVVGGSSGATGGVGRQVHSLEYREYVQ